MNEKRRGFLKTVMGTVLGCLGLGTVPVEGVVYGQGSPHPKDADFNVVYGYKYVYWVTVGDGPTYIEEDFTRVVKLFNGHKTLHWERVLLKTMKVCIRESQT